jgi:hypothetical protein
MCSPRKQCYCCSRLVDKWNKNVPLKKDVTCLILKMWKMHAKHYLYQNGVYNSFMFVNLSILISFSLSFVGSFAPFGRTCFGLCSLCHVNECTHLALSLKDLTFISFRNKSCTHLYVSLNIILHDDSIFQLGLILDYEVLNNYVLDWLILHHDVFLHNWVDFWIVI